MEERETETRRTFAACCGPSVTLSPLARVGRETERGGVSLRLTRGLYLSGRSIYDGSMNATGRARLLRRNQTAEEKSLWRALRAGRFAGFKFRRAHPVGKYVLDYYCPFAKLSIELDGFHHGTPAQRQWDAERRNFLVSEGIEELRFWNHQWNKNREGVLLEIWNALSKRTGCVSVSRKEQNRRFVPPDSSQLKEAPPLPRPSPP